MSNIIKTPFGEVDLDYRSIDFLITESSLGAMRKVEFEGIQYMSEKKQYAEIVWLIWQYNKENNLINELDAVQGRTVITPVTGLNRVTSDGILIMREVFPEGEIGDRAYQMAMNAGHNEYHYWMALLRVAPLPIVIQTAGNMLAQYNRYDRI